MKAGELRHRVAIQSGSTTENNAGGVDFAWSTVATVWAAIKPLSGSERSDTDGSHSTTTHEVRIRYYAGLTSSHRLLFGTRVFEIVAVRNLYESKRETVCDCKETDQ